MLLKSCKDLHLKLTDEQREESDIDGYDLYHEILSTRAHIKAENLQAYDVLQYIFQKIFREHF